MLFLLFLTFTKQKKMDFLFINVYHPFFLKKKFCIYTIIRFKIPIKSKPILSIVIIEIIDCLCFVSSFPPFFYFEILFKFFRSSFIGSNSNSSNNNANICPIIKPDPGAFTTASDLFSPNDMNLTTDPYWLFADVNNPLSLALGNDLVCCLFANYVRGI